MTTAGSAEAAVSRTEFELAMERIAERMTVLEASRPVSDRASTEAGADVVTQHEFRLFKWLGAFVLATVLGGFGLLYQQIADLRVEMRALHAEVLREMHSQISGLRSELHSQISGLRAQMHKENIDIRRDIASVRERVVRLESRVGSDGG